MQWWYMVQFGQTSSHDNEQAHFSANKHFPLHKEKKTTCFMAERIPKCGRSVMHFLFYFFYFFGKITWKIMIFFLLASLKIFHLNFVPKNGWFYTFWEWKKNKLANGKKAIGWACKTGFSFLLALPQNFHPLATGSIRLLTMVYQWCLPLHPFHISAAIQDWWNLKMFHYSWGCHCYWYTVGFSLLGLINYWISRLQLGQELVDCAGPARKWKTGKIT